MLLCVCHEVGCQEFWGRIKAALSWLSMSMTESCVGVWVEEAAHAASDGITIEQQQG